MIFLHFLRISQDLAKHHLLFKKHLCSGVPGKFLPFTNMPLDHGSDPGKNEINAIGSSAEGRRRARRNPARPAAETTEGGVGCDKELTTRPLVTGVGAERSPAMVRGGGCCGLNPGETAACPR
jgi:hypothetical protein